MSNFRKRCIEAQKKTNNRVNRITPDQIIIIILSGLAGVLFTKLIMAILI